MYGILIIAFIIYFPIEYLNEFDKTKFQCDYVSIFLDLDGEGYKPYAIEDCI